MPGGDFEIIWGVNDVTRKGPTHATQLNLVSNDSEDVVSYLFVMHSDALSQSENLL